MPKLKTIQQVRKADHILISDLYLEGCIFLSILDLKIHFSKTLHHCAEGKKKKLL